MTGSVVRVPNITIKNLCKKSRVAFSCCNDKWGTRKIIMGELINYRLLSNPFKCKSII